MTKEGLKSKIRQHSFGEPYYSEKEVDWLMDEWAKAILNFLLTKSDLKEIVMVDGDFYWESDKDGDQPIQPEDILKMYEKEVSPKTDNR
jgi:hypothetical protein